MDTNDDAWTLPDGKTSRLPVELRIGLERQLGQHWEDVGDQAEVEESVGPTSFLPESLVDAPTANPMLSAWCAKSKEPKRK